MVTVLRSKLSGFRRQLVETHGPDTVPTSCNALPFKTFTTDTHFVPPLNLTLGSLLPGLRPEGYTLPRPTWGRGHPWNYPNFSGSTWVSGQTFHHRPNKTLYFSLLSLPGLSFLTSPFPLLSSLTFYLLWSLCVSPCVDPPRGSSPP